jgi:hypothetical protein
MADVPELPKKTAADVAYGVVKAAVAAAPVVGGTAAEIIEMVFGPPLVRLRDEWSQQLADAVNEILKTVSELTPEKLSQSEVFVTTALPPHRKAASRRISFLSPTFISQAQ